MSLTADNGELDVLWSFLVFSYLVRPRKPFLFREADFVGKKANKKKKRIFIIGRGRGRTCVLSHAKGMRYHCATRPGANVDVEQG
jgi:hypothetical protein